MTLKQTSTAQMRWQWRWHRGLQHLGWPGVLGCLLMLLAIGVGTMAWQAQRRLVTLEQMRSEQALQRLGQTDLVAGTDRNPQRDALPWRSDVHSMIAQLHRAAQTYSLVVQAADYRHKAATAESLGRLEIHVQLRGGYRPLRLWMQQIKADIPSLILQEFNVTRPNADVAEVDAKLVLVIALADKEESPNTHAVGMTASATTAHDQGAKP
jgi:hypothetical protein